MRDAESERLADRLPALRTHGRVRHETAGLDDGRYVLLDDRDRRRTLLRDRGGMFSVQCVAVRVGEDLHGLAALDRIRGDRIRHAPRELDPEALGRARDDRTNLRLGKRLEEHLGATRADGRIDFAWIARGRADQHEIGRRAVFE
jgi:hypothetical protein